MKSLFALLAIGALSIGAIGCDVDVKEEAPTPDVDVAVPDAPDVEAPDVEAPDVEAPDVEAPDTDIEVKTDT